VGIQPLLDPGCIYIGTQVHRSGHRCCQGLSTTHPSYPTRHNQPAFQIATKILTTAFHKGFVGSLQNPLRTYVNPASRRHLPVHHQSFRLQFLKMLPGCPGRHQIAVGYEYPRCFGVRSNKPNRLARLYQQGVIFVHIQQDADNFANGFYISGCLSGTAVHNQIGRIFGYFGI